MQSAPTAQVQADAPNDGLWPLLRRSVQDWIDAGAVDVDPGRALRMRAFNKIQLAGIGLSIFWGVVLGISGHLFTACCEVLMLGVYLAGYRLSRRSRPTTARLLAIGATNLLLLVGSLEVGRSGGVQLFFFPLAIFPLTIFHRSERLEILGSMALTIAARLSLDVLAVSVGHLAVEMTGVYLASVLGAFVLLIIQVVNFGAEADHSQSTASRALFKLATEAQERRRIEAELAESRRIETMGRLAATVAYEMGPPTALLHDRVGRLAGATVDLLGVAEAARELVTAHHHDAPGVLAPDALKHLSHRVDVANLDELFGEVLEILEQTLESSQRVAAIIKTFGEFSSPDQEHKPFDLNEAVQGAILLTRNEHRSGVEVRTELGPLPPLFCGGAPLKQVLLNLLANAVQAVNDRFRDTGDPGRITVRTEVEGGAVVLKISDTGGGIPEAIRHRIFEPYFSTKSGTAATGQGLTVSRRIIEREGGTLRFETATGVGTTFIVRLPNQGNRQRSPRPADKNGGGIGWQPGVGLGG